MDLSGRAAIVTGGAGSLGRVIVAALRHASAKVVVFDALAEPEPFDDDQVTYVSADVSDESAVASALETAIAVAGNIAVLVNAAGSIHSEPLVNILATERRHGLANWERVVRANLTTTFLVGAHVAEHMAASRTKGVIINFSSVAAAGNPGQSAYAAAKAGVEALTSVWAKELGTTRDPRRCDRSGIRRHALDAGRTARRRRQGVDTANPAPAARDGRRNCRRRALCNRKRFHFGAHPGDRRGPNAMIAAPLVIFGAGKVAEVVYRYLKRAGEYEVVAFTCDAGFIPESGAFLGLPVVPFADVSMLYPPATHAMIVAIGYHDLNRVRRARYADAKAKGYRLISMISPEAHCGDWVEMGDNCIVLDGATLDPGVRLGSNVVIWSDALVGHHSTIEDHCWIAGHAVFGGTAVLGAGSFVALGAIVGNEVEIGAESFLGAGVLVTKCCEAKSVFVAPSTEKFRLDSDRFLKISKIR